MEVIKLEKRLFTAGEAQQLKDNAVLKEVFRILNERLDTRAAETPSTDISACQDIIRMKQLLVGFQQIVHTFIRDGQMARRELDIPAPKKRMFQR